MRPESAYCIRMIPAMRPLACVAVGLVMAGCGSTAVSIANLSVDASYTCPASASNAPYDVHATAEIDNPTSQSVTIESVSAVMVLAAVHGDWQQKVGAAYDAGQVQFTPKSVGASANGKLQVTIPSACTNGPHPGINDYGDYSVRLTVVTSAGTFKLTSTNKHRIIAG